MKYSRLSSERQRADLQAVAVLVKDVNSHVRIHQNWTEQRTKFHLQFKTDLLSLMIFRWIKAIVPFLPAVTILNTTIYGDKMCDTPARLSPCCFYRCSICLHPYCSCIQFSRLVENSFRHTLTPTHSRQAGSFSSSLASLQLAEIVHRY